MTTIATRTGIAAAFLVLAGVLAGCSAAGPDPASSSSGPSRSSVAHAVASCMRDAGYDVTDDDYQRFPTDGDISDRQEVLEKCTKEHDPETARQAEAAQNDPEFLAIHTKVGKCMRKAGYADYPDDSRDADAYSPPEGDPEFGEVLRKCYEGAGASVVTQ
ncbi:hypothetical protein [Curtobacterium sp. ER1/6]|uniref:hypothetical protein n=1 Tax=Curtobacterium sp. ER1/6 TaxID=1891920 RepID=UPI00084FA6C9|nr:hypothetical protein [Curtobacterium sp. ER1/6]OEI69045.1 hypothetical protein Cus16_1540 [Curtobacterium sp. ER1/6]